MKTFKQFSEGMGRTIASFQSRKGDIEIERERDPKYSKKYKYYAQVDNKWDFWAKDAKELRKKLGLDLKTAEADAEGIEHHKNLKIQQKLKRYIPLKNDRKNI